MKNKKYNPTDSQKDEFINLYLSYLDKKNASKYTKKSYKSYFKVLKTLDWSNPEFITDFLNERYDNKRTFNTAIAIFKAFFNFLNKKNIFFLDTTELLLVSAGLELKPAYSKSQFIKLEKYLQEFNNKKFSFVFYFLKSNWTRVGEFENINWDFFKRDINAVLIIQAKKNNNERIVKISKEAQEYWADWSKKPLSPVRIMHLFSEFKKFVYERDEEFKSKNIQISAHCLRTSGITKAATAGLSAVEISAITGHKTTVAIDKNYIVRNIEKTSSDMDYVNNSDLINQLDNKVLRAENFDYSHIKRKHKNLF
ncbi:tyrosine-type recombinase/integrase [Mycoplasma sp. 1890]